MRGIGAQVDLVMPLRDRERLGQLARPGAEPPDVFHLSSLTHDLESPPRFDRADQDETIARPAFNEHVQHPVHAVIEIDVGRARLVALDEGARARPIERVTSLVPLHQIRLGLDHNARAFSPDEPAANQIFRALQRIDLEK